MLQSKDRWFALMAGVFILGVAIIALSRMPLETATEAVSTKKPAPWVSFPAPDFTLTTLSGEKIALSHLRDQVVLINFWATWCPPCRVEIPDLQASYESCKEQGLVVLGVNIMENLNTVKAFARQFGMTYPILLDEAGQVSRTYQVQGIPTSFFVGRDGIIKDTFIGPMNQAYIRNRVAPLLGEGRSC